MSSFTPLSNLNGGSSASLGVQAAQLGSVQILGPSQTRNGLYFYNDVGSGNCLIAYDVTASLTHYTHKIPASGSLNLFPTGIYCGPISVCWDSVGAGSGLHFTETA
ncbi:MAG: hypothetical protein JOZ27_06685 [Caulobacteraceae bacterium]|nr:hypothetical protein [Caulobacteraceae bacterium]